MSDPSGFIELRDLPPKTSPVANDIIYMGNSIDSFNEIKVSQHNLFNNAPLLKFGKYIIGNAATYANGTISQTGNVITGVGTLFTSTNLKGGQLVVFQDGSYAMVNNVVSDTSLIVDNFASVPLQSYTMYYNGVQIDNLGTGSVTNLNLSPIVIPSSQNSDFTPSAIGCMYNIDTTSAVVNVTLPYAANIAGKVYIFKVVAGANNVILSRNGTDLIDGATSYTLNVGTSPKASVTIVSDGVGAWSITAVV